MDKLTFFSCLLFLTADVFIIVAISMPDWIVTNVGGDTRLGLLRSCMTIHGRGTTCFTPSLPPEWFIALILILFGCLCLTTTLTLTILAPWTNRNVRRFAKWVGFAAVIVFCLAAVIFPVGFSIDEIGGAPYQLPNSFQVGLAYIFFVMALWITVISELFASKICLPHF